jgi:hypothetical protein
MEYGKIIHSGQHAVVNANDARPLAQAVVALRQEYGWKIDYEDPIYAASELIPVPIVDPDMLATHPNAKRALRPSGGAFSSTYPEDLSSGMNTDQQRRDIFEHLLADYAKSGNPGHFELRLTASGRFDVIGNSDSEAALLDKKLSLIMDGVAYVEIEKLLRLVQQQTGHKVGLGFAPINALMHCTVSRSFSAESARVILLETLGTCHLNVVWQFLYDAGLDLYLLNLEGVAMAYHDLNGNHMLVPVPQR